MYSQIINFANGFSLIPVIYYFKKTGVFKHLKKPITFNKLIIKGNFNSGYLYSGLYLLLVLDVIEKKNNKFKIKNLAIINYVTSDLIILYKYSFEEILHNDKCIKLMNRQLKNMVIFSKTKKFDTDIILGVLLIPLFFYLKINLNKKNFVKKKKYNFIKKYLVSRKWLLLEKNKYVFSKSGNYLIERINIAGVVASYRNTLYNFNELIHKDPKIFFNKFNIYESHLDRKLNIQASTSQHNKYFNKINNIIIKIFSYKIKPKFILDIGCGDGSLLKSIYQTIKKNISENEANKITFIGIDLNNISLNAAKKNLKHIKSFFIKESIDNPKNIFEILSQKKIYKNQILHIRSFVDHERNINIPNNKNFNDFDYLNYNDIDVKGVSEEGTLINSKIINNSLDIFYKLWSNYIGKFGLINLEVHKQSFKSLKNNLSINEGTSFDFIQLLSKQYLVKPETHLYVLYKNQLFPKELYLYPPTGSFVRISLGYFKKMNQKLLISIDKNNQKIIFNNRKFNKNIISLTSKTNKKSLMNFIKEISNNDLYNKISKPIKIFIDLFIL